MDLSTEVLNRQTVKRLRELCRENVLDIPWRARKAELIRYIQDNLAQGAMIRSPLRSPVRPGIRSPVRSPTRSQVRSSPLPAAARMRSPVRSPKRSPIHVREEVDCLICGDTKEGMSLSCCDNPICFECLSNLRSFNCPYCRSDISGRIPSKMIEVIDTNLLKDKLEEEDMNELIARLSQMFPEVPVERLYDIYVQRS